QESNQRKSQFLHTYDNGHMSPKYFLHYFTPLVFFTPKLNLVNQSHVIQDHVKVSNFDVDHHG
ncbi:hypothetical protein OV015_25960, partial [Salmonella enterica subsp. enterica serovar 1,4,[5],12:i:-]|nr:hypothetical protein [Salmonella enterica subsp. enterica serovar 1,4,[5],12:i:-]